MTNVQEHGNALDIGHWTLDIRHSLCFCALGLTLAAGSAAAQRPIPYPVSVPPEFARALAGGTRTATGAPGPRYWQQWTDYTLHARLDPAASRLEVRARIDYHNRSPNPLPVVFVQLLQNLHQPGAVRNEPEEITGGVVLDRVAAGGRILSDGTIQLGSAYEVIGTTMAIRPPQPVPTGGRLALEIDWHFLVPRSGAGRMGHSADSVFHIAYWYPQMAVYDDVVGWQVDQYLGGSEFYAGFGSYDLTVEVPEGWVVTATGRLANAAEVLPDPTRRRLEQAEQSDTVVHVLTAADLGPGRATRPAPGGWHRWRFVADTARDAAFSALRYSLWDAARTPVGDRDGDGRVDYTRVDAFWRDTARHWRNAWRYAQHAIDFLSRWTGLPYPWPHATAVEGGGIIGGGMEFPMMTLIGDYNDRTDSALYYVVAHELAHMWVPMTVANDERRYAWMDEGTTTFNENQSRAEFFPGPDHPAGDREDYLQAARAGLEGEIMRWSDYHYPGPAYGIASYQKPATLLASLRALLGEETFTRAYREYLRRWRYKHPKPWDFFNTFDAVSGRDLDWFWRTWYYETWTLDQAVASVTAEAAGTTIVIEDRGWAPMPARVTVRRADGSSENHEIPVETWLGGAIRAEIRVSAGSPVTEVTIDADNRFPDVDRSNNRWSR
jgi:hypothetical protein